jgi:hypothetical protein
VRDQRIRHGALGEEGGPSAALFETGIYAAKCVKNSVAVLENASVTEAVAVAGDHRRRRRRGDFGRPGSPHSGTRRWRRASRREEIDRFGTARTRLDERPYRWPTRRRYSAGPRAAESDGAPQSWQAAQPRALALRHAPASGARPRQHPAIGCGPAAGLLGVGTCASLTWWREPCRLGGSSNQSVGGSPKRLSWGQDARGARTGLRCTPRRPEPRRHRRRSPR